MKKKFKPIVVLDFDGVVHFYGSGWKGPRVIADGPVDGSIEWIINALEHFDLHIFSSRSHQWGGRRAMKRWLHDQIYGMANTAQAPEWLVEKVCYHSFMEPWHITADDYAWSIVNAIKWPIFKSAALMTIDDRAITFTGKFPTIEEIKRFKPWNKK